jgi:hypothetical protein
MRQGRRPHGDGPAQQFDDKEAIIDATRRCHAAFTALGHSRVTQTAPGGPDDDLS